MKVASAGGGKAFFCDLGRVWHKNGEQLTQGGRSDVGFA